MCASSSALSPVGPSALWSRHSAIILIERRSSFSCQWHREACPVLPGTTQLCSRHRRLCSPLPSMPFPLPAPCRVSQPAPCPPAKWPLGSTLRPVCLVLPPASWYPPSIPWFHDQTPWHDAHPKSSILQRVGWWRSHQWWIPPRIRSSFNIECVGHHLQLPTCACLYFLPSMQLPSVLRTSGPSVGCGRLSLPWAPCRLPPPAWWFSASLVFLVVSLLSPMIAEHKWLRSLSFAFPSMWCRRLLQGRLRSCSCRFVHVLYHCSPCALPSTPTSLS